MTAHFGAYMDTPVRHFPAFCLPNVDKDSYVLEFTGHELLYTDPIIETVIASPPYWEGINEEGSGGTTYGTSSGSGSGSGHSGGFAAACSIGAEYEDPLGLFGAEFKVSVENSMNWGSSKSKEVTETWSYNTGVGEDKVVFTAIPFDVYYYKVITAPSNDPVGPSGGKLKPGDTMVINVPRQPGTFNQELNYYNTHNGTTWDVVLPHTLGSPLTYTTQSGAAGIKEGSKQGGKARGLYSTKGMTVGVGDTGNTGQSVEEMTSEEKSFDYGVELSIEGEMKAGGVTVGASEKFNYGYGVTNSVSSSIFIEGEVPDIPTALHTTALDFKWGLLMYPTTGTGQAFNLVTYWVDKK
jgi:hypothetical protein